MPQGGLRIYVQGGGCSGFSLRHGARRGQPTATRSSRQDGIKVIVDPMSMRYLEGAEVDYKEDLMGGGFAIKNPNATSTCGCGHSFNAGGEGGGRRRRTRPPALRRPRGGRTSGASGEVCVRRRPSLTRAPSESPNA